jgi:hypothetical protein
MACLDLEIQADLTCNWKKMGNSAKPGLIFLSLARWEVQGKESTGELGVEWGHLVK